MGKKAVVALLEQYRQAARRTREAIGTWRAAASGLYVRSASTGLIGRVLRLGGAVEQPQEETMKKFPQLGTCGPTYCTTRVIPIPSRSLHENKVILDESDPVAEHFKLLRTLIFNKMRPEGLNTLQITGFGCGEGKSHIAANLAISIARDSRQTTLLVDLDFRNPSVHCLFGLGETVPGVASYLSGEAGLEEIFINPGIEKLTILPAGCRTVQAAELMGSAKMEALVKQLKERYPDRFIIFDTPPMNDVPDALVFSQYVDSLLLVARAGLTTQDSVKKARGLVPNEKVLGVVFNDYKVQGPAKGYGSR